MLYYIIYYMIYYYIDVYIILLLRLPYYTSMQFVGIHHGPWNFTRRPSFFLNSFLVDHLWLKELMFRISDV